MNGLVQPIGVCRADAVDALSAALPNTQLLSTAGLAALVVPPAAAPTPAARVALAGRAADIAHAFAPVATLPQPADAVVDWLTEAADALSEALERVSGAAEWVVTVPVALAPHVPAETGRAFLHARAEAARRAGETREVLTRFARSLAPGPRAFRVIVHGEGADLSLLTDRQDTVRTRSQLLAACAVLPESALHGPFPPYGFCAATLETIP